MSETSPTRRRFLQCIACLPATAAVGACASSSGAEPVSFGDVSAGNVSSLPVGTVRAVASHPVAIGRDAGGLYAMTLTCTHEGCDMSTQGSVSSSGIECDCHGSRFDVHGNVTQGPATQALRHYSVSVDGSGGITVHGGTPVDAATRTKV